MNEDVFAAWNDATDQILELTAGYRRKCEEQGFSKSIAEAMALQYHQLLVQQAVTAASRSVHETGGK